MTDIPYDTVANNTIMLYILLVMLCLMNKIVNIFTHGVNMVYKKIYLIKGATQKTY